MKYLEIWVLAALSLVGVLMFPSSVVAFDIAKDDMNPYAISHYITKRKVADLTELYDSTAASLHQASKIFTKVSGSRRILLPLRKYVDSNIPTENYTLMTAAESIVSFMEESAHPKATKARKDLSKGRLNKECGPVLEERISVFDDATSKARNTLHDLEKMLDSLELKGLLSTSDQLEGMDGVRIVTVYDTIANPLFNTHMAESRITLSQEAVKEQLKGWEWTRTDELVLCEKLYPTPIKYHFYKHHPDYFVDEDNSESRRFLFNRKGNLVRVVTMRPMDVSIHENDYDTKTLFYRMAWLANAHNVQSETLAVKHAIKVRCGLEDLTSEEKARIAKKDKALDKALSTTMSARMRYGNSWVSDAIGREATLKWLSMPGGMSVPERARNWMNQIDEDYKGTLGTPYKVERVDEVTFGVTLVDSDYYPTYLAIFRYEGAKPSASSNLLGVTYKLIDLRKINNAKSFKWTYSQNMVMVDTVPGMKTANRRLGDSKGRYFAVEDVDVQASYGKYEDALSAYVNANLIWPSTTVSTASLAAEIVIDRDGTPIWTEVKFADTPDPDFEDEILRLVDRMGKWTPAQLHGKPVRSRVVVRLELRYNGRQTAYIFNDAIYGELNFAGMLKDMYGPGIKFSHVIGSTP